MLLRATDVSEAAIEEERARRRDIYRLLYFVERRFYSPTNVEWRLMEHCLDDINYKYADFSFLVGFASAVALRNRTGHSFVSRYRLPLYVGLLAYDNALRTTNPCPSVAFWNSVTLLDSPLGETARALHAPQCFYEIRQRQKNSTTNGLSYLSCLWEAGDYLFNSLLLQSFLRHAFDQSCWMQKTGEDARTALVVNSRFFRWDVFELCTRNDDLETTYEMKISLPRLIVPLGLRHSYRSRHMILENSSFGSKMWYSLHFAVLRLLGFHDGYRIE